MAYATEYNTSETRVADRLTALWKQLQAARAQRRLFTGTVRERNQLSGRELADLGITRSEIRHIAWHAAYGK
ncbi:DUF1127 domain-containing protein [Aliiroseovarius sp.]|uniref:DUF1127 domain-containing protein n=1 Tax=Aliiroseovarius sp. TaxID=1872442 RepID=UPI0026398DB3|nr:DUF1127 domain-containing protein [Aliiroseovarius sp.]